MLTQLMLIGEELGILANEEVIGGLSERGIPCN